MYELEEVTAKWYFENWELDHPPYAELVSEGESHSQAATIIVAVAQRRGFKLSVNDVENYLDNMKEA